MEEGDPNNMVENVQNGTAAFEMFVLIIVCD